ncbi:MAG: SRPBCC family protein [Thermoleophilaceae bacterium]
MSLDVTANASIPAERHAVWSYATEPTNDPQWITGIRSAAWLTEPPLREGTRVERTASFLGRPIEYVLEVLEHEHGSRLRMKSIRAPFPMDVTYEFADAGGETAVSIRVRGGPAGLKGLADPVMAPMVRRSLRADLRNLRARFESWRRSNSPSPTG